MKKLLTIGMFLIATSNSALASGPASKKECTTAASGVAYLIGAVVHGRCTGLSDTEIRAKVKASLISNPLSLDLRSEDLEKIIRINGAPPLPVCAVVDAQISDLVAASEVEKKRNSTENIHAELERLDADAKETQRVLAENLKKASKANNAADREFAETYYKTIAQAQDLMRAKYRESVLSRRGAVVSFTPEAIRNLSEGKLSLEIYGQAYVDICNPAVMVVRDAANLSFDSSFIDKMVKLAVDFLPTDTWQMYYHTEGELLVDLGGVAKGEYTNATHPLPALKGLSREFDPRNPTVWKELVAASASKNDKRGFATRNPQLLIDHKAGISIPLFDLAEYKPLGEYGVSVKNIYTDNIEKVTAKMNNLGLLDTIIFRDNGGKQVVVFTSPTAFYNIAFKKSPAGLSFFAAAPSFGMRDALGHHGYAQLGDL